MIEIKMITDYSGDLRFDLYYQVYNFLMDKCEYSSGSSPDTLPERHIPFRTFTVDDDIFALLIMTVPNYELVVMWE